MVITGDGEHRQVLTRSNVRLAQRVDLFRLQAGTKYPGGVRMSIWRRITEALGLRFECLRQGPLGSPFLARRRTSRVDHSWSFQRVRSQSFLSWRLHLNTSLRASAGRTASAQASLTAWHGTVLCDHPARPGSSQSHRRPSGITPERSMSHLGLSKARRDRDQGHDRCNHHSVVSRPPVPTSV